MFCLVCSDDESVVVGGLEPYMEYSFIVYSLDNPLYHSVTCRTAEGCEFFICFKLLFIVKLADSATLLGSPLSGSSAIDAAVSASYDELSGAVERLQLISSHDALVLPKNCLGGRHPRTVWVVATQELFGWSKASTRVKDVTPVVSTHKFSNWIIFYVQQLHKSATFPFFFTVFLSALVV
jgi:hypothetical protein